MTDAPWYANLKLPQAVEPWSDTIGGGAGEVEESTSTPGMIQSEVEIDLEDPNKVWGYTNVKGRLHRVYKVTSKNIFYLKIKGVSDLVIAAQEIKPNQGFEPLFDRGLCLLSDLEKTGIVPKSRGTDIEGFTLEG